MKYEDNLFYHVFNRGAHKALIFPSKHHYRLCVELLEKYAEKYFTFIAAYCLMPNHYHLILRQETEGSISKCIQTVFNSYSQTINVQSGHSGTLFQGKAKGKLIDSDTHISDVVRYIHLNPVRVGLIAKPEEWSFSDYNEWIGKKECHVKNKEFQRQYFSNGDDYRLFVEDYKEEMDKQKIEKYLI